MATSSAGWDNKFSTTLSSGITASDTTIPLTNLPTASEGWLVIEPDSSTAWEEIYYTSKTGSAVVCPSVGAGRGQGGSTAASHSSGATVRCDTTAEMFEALQDGTAFSDGSHLPRHLVSGTGSTWTWQTWTPTFTNLTVGNGTLTGKYIQIGKTVTARFNFVFGSTSSVSGDVDFTLPVTAASYAGTASLTPIGVAHMLNTSSGVVVFGFPELFSTTKGKLRAVQTDATYGIITVLSNTIPFGEAWATGDEISLQITYEAA